MPFYVHYCPQSLPPLTSFLFFFFNDPPTTEIYTLSLHDALPIWSRSARRCRLSSSRNTFSAEMLSATASSQLTTSFEDRKSTRLNSSHVRISYAVFCLKKKNKLKTNIRHKIKLTVKGRK